MNEGILKDIFNYLKEEGVEALYIPSFDEYMSEYVPRWNNLRYLATGFTGSMGDALATSDKLYLFVDGRYHIQIDEEVDSPLIENVKLLPDVRIFQSVFDKVRELGLKKVGIFSERTPLSFQDNYLSEFQVVEVNESKFHRLVNLERPNDFGEVKSVDKSLLGQNVQDRRARIDFKNCDAYFLSALDDIAWITNARGYHLSFQSSFLAKALVTKEKIVLFSPEGISFSSDIDKSIEVLNYKGSLAPYLSQKINELGLKKITVDANFCSIGDFQTLKEADVEIIKGNGLTDVKSVKFEVELPAYEKSFEKGSQSIYEIITWLKSSVANGQKVSEKDLYNKTSESYKKNSAITQSFNTISGVGENGAIVHYGNPKSNRYITDGELVLLDSGGYFDAGVSTDTTRTFLAGKLENLDHRKYFTMVLKAQMNAEMAVFPSGTPGNVIAMLCDQVLYQEGLSYAHGLGHGVGIHVHEPGTGLAAGRKFPIIEGHILSIEPGLYFKDKFGIRHENVCYVEKHPTLKGMLRFKNLVYVGIDSKLVDESLLTDKEKQYFLNYQKECEKRGRSL